ncbi:MULTISPECIES: glycosyltransferase family 2 protein [unclassified Spirosoma]|uniref:glycosyltransferase family 2 protein n=1 Tax=unclassified Spirosoma TaxID=2621999 RepID=UPI0009650218|nr:MULTISPECIES: glycosyltransferase family 2 protein [unclassified Spirosoma]MBN8824533.1 glycosyltransferase family 2 protein [Spirosoma sp.]OJW70900.1 MAG: glycosyl transferase [Spirosoma sp. 48-14]
MTDQVFVIIPSFNEGKVIRQTIRSLGNQYTVVLVDDASTDDTANAVRDLPIYYLRHDINLGQGAALQTGMDFALQQGADIVVHFDADGQHNPADIDRFISVLKDQKVDIVLGSRFMRQDDFLAIPRLRRLLLRVARIVNGLLTGLWLSDAHNGFRVMNRQALRSIQLKENRMAHATEILMQIRRKHLHFIECPTHIIYTDYSQVKGQRWQGAIDILIDVFINKYFR